MKFLVIGSKSDKASRNILMNIMDFGDIPYYYIDEELLNEKNFDMDKINQYDFIIFASKHKSEKGKKSLSVHAPGNWKEVWGGGTSGKVCQTSALFNKHLFETLKEIRKEMDLEKYELTLEVTHHGPLINKPCVFIEIGSSEAEWQDRRAAFCIARTIKKAIETFKPNPFREIAIGIGGPHYCPSFNKLQLNSNIAFSHIIPDYVAPITSEMILEAIEKTLEEVDFVVLDWKGLGKAEERDKIVQILDKNYIQYKRANEVNKKEE